VNTGSSMSHVASPFSSMPLLCATAERTPLQ
jgi:hypothetical protein